jgi:hypothetical protein
MGTRLALVRWCLRVSLLVLVSECNGAAQQCPPDPEPAAVKVPGKPDEMGWRIEDKGNEADANGNEIQVWCLKKLPAGKASPAHNGPELALLYKPAPPAKDADAVWIGACVFDGAVVNGQEFPARNKTNKAFKLGADGKPILKNGAPEQFATVTWYNYEPFPNGTHDWDYSYDTATGKLTLSKTTGAYLPVTDPTTGKKGFKYKTTKVDGTDTYTAPTNFGDIKFLGTQVTDASGYPGFSAETFTAVASVSGHNWSYTLNVSALGSGTDADPYTGTEADLMAGDTFSISGTGIQSASVSSPASLPEYGGWIVQSSTSNSVTFMATANVDFDPGFTIPGFGLSSAAPAGTVAWYLASSNETIGSSGTVSGPITPPDQLHLAGPSPDTIPVGQDGSIVATAETGFVPMPGMTLTYTKLAGDFTFNDGVVSSSGVTATQTTATNGAAVMEVTARSAGLGLVRVNIANTNLSAYAVFTMH